MHKAFLTLFLATTTIPALAASSQPDTLSKVMDSHILRVCSPGDYKPFSFEKDGKFSGLDNDLMDELAKSLSAKPVMVKTSWSNLMKDFTSGKCDIAVGGISITLPRQQQALFSQPYFINGKTPLVRCEDQKKYQSVADINRPNVRIVANPGGSNENYARNTLSQAQLTMHPNNLTIFDELIQRRADVFVTEAAEARVKQHEHAGVLCAVNPDKPLRYAENGYLIHNGDYRFKLYVDQFLNLSKKSGLLNKLIEKWLPK